MKNRSRSYIIIVGCGALGSSVAGKLSASGANVVVVDKNREAFKKLPPEFSGFTVMTEVIGKNALIDSKIEQADILIATTDDDNTNIMIAQIAKRVYHVPKVVARIFEPSRMRVYEDLDIETISPTVLAASVVSDNILREGESDN
ncbi:TrkA family potassium uptake protein [Mesotoga prima]|jgi:trk system potassium uptake protein TrkA|uniref:potassium channel family protein n=1 Tax=Mesotoga prima TaxID=1184387 RepID=UPI002FE3E8F3